MNILDVRAFNGISETMSSPLKCDLSDGFEYYCKKNGKAGPPNTDLINEVLFNKLQNYFGIKTPEICLVNFDYSTYEEQLAKAFEKIQAKYRAKNITIPNHFTADKFAYPIFGSKVIEPHVEFKPLNPKGSFILEDYNSPIDILKIGFFDLWISNKDRKPSNSNVIVAELAENGLQNLIPIDNCQAFNNLKDYVSLFTKTSIITVDNSLLSCGFTQQVVDEITVNDLDNLTANLVNLAQNSLSLMEEIFEEIPIRWELSNKHKSEIINFLTDTNRINTISETFRLYIAK